MQNFSEFIVEAMKHIDGKILQIDSRSIDRERLHNQINTQIVANVQTLAGLSKEKAYRRIDDIFKEQLKQELLRRL